MPRGQQLFTPVGGGPRSRINAKSPAEFISPATRRTPLSTVNTPSTILTPSTIVNDDEREKKERRRSKVLDLQHMHVSSPASNARDRRRSMPQSGLSNQQVADHYANCIKLSAENKINAKNAFGLHLIDYMSELLKKKELNNFQVASSTLDASAKIYAGRVDAIHTETYKVLTGLGRTEGGKGEGQDGEAVEGEEHLEEGERKRKRARRSHTVETNLKNINVSKFDLEFEVDPLFHQTSAAFDEGGTGGLLMNHLHLLDNTSQLVLDSETIVGHVDTDLSASFTEARSQPVDLTEFKSKYSCFSDGLQVCSEFADFSFTNWSIEDAEESMLQSQKSQKDAVSSQHAFDLDAEAEPVPGLSDDGTSSAAGGAMTDDFMDDFAHLGDDDDGDTDAASVATGALDLSDMLTGDGKEARMVDHFLHNMKDGSIGTLMQILAAEPSDYSYFNSRLLRTWAGPSHWKMKARKRGELLAAAGEKGKKGKDKKEAFVINYDEEINFDSHFKEKRAATTLTKATLDKYSKSQTTLPEDLHYDVDKLFRLFIKAKLMIKRREGDDNDSNTDADAAVDNYDYDNPADRGSFCHAADDDHDDDDAPLDFDLTAGTNDVFSQSGQGDLNTTSLTGDKLVAQPNTVAKIDIGYAKTAKKMDVKKLKSSIWGILVKPEKKPKVENEVKDEETESIAESVDSAPPPPTATVEEPHSFQKLVEVLPKKLSGSMAKNLSVPIAFVCLLHLANEKTLSITSGSDMSDLQITQG